MLVVWLLRRSSEIWYMSCFDELIYDIVNSFVFELIISQLTCILVLFTHFMYFFTLILFKTSQIIFPDVSNLDQELYQILFKFTLLIPIL